MQNSSVSFSLKRIISNLALCFPPQYKLRAPSLKYLIFAYACFACTYIYISCAHNVHRGEKRVLDVLKIESQAVVSFEVDAENQSQVPCTRTASALTHRAISLTPTAQLGEVGPRDKPAVQNADTHQTVP